MWGSVSASRRIRQMRGCSQEAPRKKVYSVAYKPSPWTDLNWQRSNMILAFKFPFVCSERLWQQSTAPRTGIKINITSFKYLWAHCFPFIPFTDFLFLLTILSHFCRTGGTGVKLMWWNTTGISLWAICFSVMATLSLSSAWLWAFCCDWGHTAN